MPASNDDARIVLVVQAGMGAPKVGSQGCSIDGKVVCLKSRYVLIRSKPTCTKDLKKKKNRSSVIIGYSASVAALVFENSTQLIKQNVCQRLSSI